MPKPTASRSSGCATSRCSVRGNAPIWRLPPDAYQDRVGQIVNSQDAYAPGPLDVLEAIGVYEEVVAEAASRSGQSP